MSSTMSTERSTSTMTIMTMEPAELGESPKNKFTNTFLNVVFYVFAVSYKAFAGYLKLKHVCRL
jgi:hypothetical protein